MYSKKEVSMIEEKIRELAECEFQFLKLKKTQDTLVFSGLTEKKGYSWNVDFEIEKCDLEEDWKEKEWQCFFSPGKDTFEEVEKKIEEKELLEWTGKIIKGFKLTRSKNVTKYKGQKIDDKYYKWQAYQSINGKRYCIHIGKDPRLAEDKINKYIEVHPEIKEVVSAK